MSRKKIAAPVLPAHTWPGDCPGHTLGEHSGYLVPSSGRVFCASCGTEATVSRPARPVTPRGGLYVRDTDTENAREAVRVFVEAMGWGAALLIDPRAAVSWRILDTARRPVAVAKAIQRSIAWSQHEDYAFSRHRWERIRKAGADAGLPAFLIVTTADGARGYVPVVPAVVRDVSTRGARGNEDRGDYNDDEPMVHIEWRTFTRIGE